jgi:hypothetical protein
MPVREAVDFAREYAGGRAVAIHDGLLNDNGLRVVTGVMIGLLSAREIDFARVPSGTDL